MEVNNANMIHAFSFPLPPLTTLVQITKYNTDIVYHQNGLQYEAGYLLNHSAQTEQGQGVRPQSMYRQNFLNQIARVGFH